MKKNLVIIFTLLICSHVVSGQWLPGKLLLKDGTSLTGQANLIDESTLNFKSAQSGVTSFGPAEVQSFEYGTTRYASTAFVNLDPSYAKYMNGHSFVRALVSGPLMLYYQRNRNNRELPRYFIAKRQNDPAILLLQLHKTSQVNGLEYKSVVDNYKEQIRTLFSDCKTNLLKEGHDYYFENDMTELFLAYYNCAGIKSDYQQVRSKEGLQLDLVAGISQSSIRLSEAYFGMATHFAQITPVFGIKGSVYLNSLHRYKINGGITYQSLHLEDMNTFSSTSYLRSLFYASRISINLGFERQWALSGRWRLAATLGLNASLLSSAEFGNNLTYNGSNGVIKPRYDVANRALGLFGGLGLERERLGLWLTTDGTLGSISVDPALKLNLTNTYLCLSYRIKN